MKSKLMLVGLLALGISSLSAYACHVKVFVACEDGTPSSGVEVYIDTPAGHLVGTTDQFGTADITVGNPGTWQVCVNPASLPEGLTLPPGQLCQEVLVLPNYQTPFRYVEFILKGDCGQAPPGPCWLTGGGTLDKSKGVPHYSFGGVVYPGCSPRAAEGGNWNVIDHDAGLHFQGQVIVVDSCSGVSTKSPKVNVNIIDFHGTGIVSGIGGNPEATVDVLFVGRAVDNLEPGGGSDLLYLSVSYGASTVLQIGTSPDDPMVLSTGNLQIHTTGCNK